MPKDPSVKFTSASVNLPPKNSQVLKRNQACHSCRRRKLKCDAKRPCSTCVRSLAHSKAHPQPGVILPDEPDCTYDGSADVNYDGPPKTRYEKLNDRLRDLEAIVLSDKTGSNDPIGTNGYQTGLQDIESSPLGGSSVNVVEIPVTQVPLAGSSSHESTPHRDPGGNFANAIPLRPNFDFQLDVMWYAWPHALPNPDLVRHLAESFFSFHPHANRLFHQSTFMTSLMLPPNHANFPCTAVLHAICGIGSMYTATIPRSELTSRDVMSPVFQEKHEVVSYGNGFAELHIKLARSHAEANFTHGRNLLQSQQALILVAWWYWCQAKWVEVYMLVAQITRICLPLGLHSSPIFKPLSDGLFAPALIPPPENDIEMELRCNIFWLAYALERLSGCGNSWPSSLDDQDVSQLLPVNATSFKCGISWPSFKDREHPWRKEVLLTHNTDQVDGFVLFIKGCILLSKVKTFNLRYAIKKYNQDHSVMYSAQYKDLWEGALSDNEKRSGSVDPRRTAAFLELQRLAENFNSSFPQHMRDPMASGAIDAYVYVASLMSHVALILLHDPHAHVEFSTCQSAANLLKASRAILELLCLVESTTSYDLSLFDFFCSFAWFVAGRSLTRFWQVAIQADSDDQIHTFRTEVEYIATMLRRAGNRVPLAHRYGVMLSDHVARLVGINISESSTV